MKPFIIFFTGLSNSGKTTLSKLLKIKLNKMGYKNVVNIDGDVFRKKIKNFFYDTQSRNSVGDKKIKLAKKLLNKGYIVIVSGIAPNKKWRTKHKKSIKNFYYVYLNCSFKESLKRNKIKNKKFLIKKNKNIVGKNQKYEKSNNNDVVINTQKLNKNRSIVKIIKFLIRKKLILMKI